MVKRHPSKTPQKLKKSRKRFLKRSFVFVFLGASLTVLLGFFSLIFFENQQFCANSISCIKDLSGKFDPRGLTGTFDGKRVHVPDSVLAAAYVSPQKVVLGENTGTKVIKVDLAAQHLYAYQGDTLVMDFPVSTGKWNKTPVGTYHIWVKLRYTRMTGGEGSTYYDLPNVPYTMFFANDDVSRSQGFSIHGAYWHNNFGHPMSHGCVNMRIYDAQKVFEWADPQTTGWSNQTTTGNPGTEVDIYGTTPAR
ncbi:MAG: L,D-transpeptidase [Candidatus Levyibacteriota bacterium]